MRLGGSWDIVEQLIAPRVICCCGSENMARENRVQQLGLLQLDDSLQHLGDDNKSGSEELLDLLCLLCLNLSLYKNKLSDATLNQ